MRFPYWITALAVVATSALPLAPAATAYAGQGDHRVLLAAGDVAKCDTAGDEATAAQGFALCSISPSLGKALRTY